MIKDEQQLTGFVVTPLGVIMHAENHRKLVEAAEVLGKSSLLNMLIPAEPLDESSFLVPA